MLSCKEVTRLVSESLDRELPLYQRLAIKAHYRICEFCARYYQQMLFIREAFRHYSAKIEDPDPSSTSSLSLEARERIKRRILEQDQKKGEESSSDQT